MEVQLVRQVLRQVLHQEPLLEVLQEKSMINRLIMEMKQVEINKIIKKGSRNITP